MSNSIMCDKDNCKYFYSIEDYCCKDDEYLKQFESNSMISYRTDKCMQRYKEENKNTCYGKCDCCYIHECNNKKLKTSFIRREL